MKRPSIHQLEVFCKVVQLESMARAAEEFSVAPSSVSMQIQELERRFRTPLLVRGPRRTAPTAAGTVLYTQALALLEGLDAVERELSQLGALESGTLRFAASRTIGAGVVRPVLQSFERAHPNVDISYHVMASSQQAKTEVLDERAEFALVGRAAPDWPLAVTPLFEEPLVVAICPDHPLVHDDLPTIESLAPHVLLLREFPVLGHERIKRLLEQSGVRPTICEFGSTEAVKAAALAGRGVAVLPRTTVADELTSGALLCCSVEGFEPYRAVFLLSLPNTPFSPVAESFVCLMRERYGALGQPVSG
ncbi:MAG: LysR family transcriptional regulator [Propionibacteriales bacterium]|nr:LysR family transcriptional regulator [Propionibacteriales bacterium]